MAWRDEETLKLIDVWSESNVQEEVEGCRRNKHVYVTQYWKTSLIAPLLILRYGRVKSPQVYLAKNYFLL